MKRFHTNKQVNVYTNNEVTMANRSGRKRLSVDLPLAIHEKLLHIKTTRRCTITKYIIRSIIKKMKEEGVWDK